MSVSFFFFLCGNTSMILAKILININCRQLKDDILKWHCQYFSTHALSHSTSFILDWVAFNSEINMLKTQNNVSISILVQGKQGIFLSSSSRILLTCTFAFQNWFSEIFMAKLLCLFKIQQLLRKLFKAIKIWLIYMVVYLTKLSIMSWAGFLRAQPVLWIGVSTLE